MTPNLNALDAFLQQKKTASLAWNEGGQFEAAEAILASFTEPDWQALAAQWRDKNNSWKLCLASVLNPYYGNAAQDLLIAMACCKSPAIASEAMYAICFYCGINENIEGYYIDNAITHPPFKQKLQQHSKFIAAIPEIGQLVGRKYELLETLLG